MFITYMIDNQTHTIREVLARLLKEHEGCLDIVTACFNTGGVRKRKTSKNKT